MQKINPNPGCSSYFDYLPDELLLILDQYLSFEDSANFMSSSDRVRRTIQGNFSSYDRLQLSDDPSECRVSDSRGRRRPRTIRDTSTPAFLQLAAGIKEVTIVIKEVDIRKQGQGLELRECSPYSNGGYLSAFLRPCAFGLTQLQSLTLHADIMVESFKECWLPCPTEDLFFALQALPNAPFETSIQISLCCAELNDTDVGARNLLIGGMEHALKAATQLGANTQFVVEPAVGYVDMTVEKGNVDYSFAFFYYNPSICEAVVEPEQNAEQQRTELCV